MTRFRPWRSLEENGKRMGNDAEYISLMLSTTNYADNRMVHAEYISLMLSTANYADNRMVHAEYI